MRNTKIERVDSLPVIVEWLLRMNLAQNIDKIWSSHANWQGLSYGPLAVLLVAYIIHQRSHRLSSVEEWTQRHKNVLEQATGWTIREKEATDDRLGILLEALGGKEEQCLAFQKEMGRHLLQAYDLPTDIGHYDTTSFSVHHSPAKETQEEHDLLRFGYSKDKHPDLLQFKQGLGTLDPAGVPLVSHTLSGEQADDGLYLPVWQPMSLI